MESKPSVLISTRPATVTPSSTPSSRLSIGSEEFSIKTALEIGAPLSEVWPIIRDSVWNVWDPSIRKECLTDDLDLRGRMPDTPFKARNYGPSSKPPRRIVENASKAKGNALCEYSIFISYCTGSKLEASTRYHIWSTPSEAESSTATCYLEITESWKGETVQDVLRRTFNVPEDHTNEMLFCSLRQCIEGMAQAIRARCHGSKKRSVDLPRRRASVRMGSDGR